MKNISFSFDLSNEFDYYESMDYKKIIAESWEYTQKNKKLIRWYGFFPAIFTTTWSVGYITYQIFAFKNSYLFSEEDHGFLFQVINLIIDFMKAHLNWTVPLVIAAAIFALFYLLFPTLAKSSAIQMIARNRNGQPAGVGTGMRHGILSFLPLFEYHLLIKTFAFFSIIFEMSFVARNLGLGIFSMLLPIFILFIVISFILTLLFTYSDLYIVIDDDGVFTAMKKSAKLVLLHWKHTFLITVLMLLIGVRIIIQVVMVFLIPLMVILLTGYIATVALPITGIVVGAIVGFIGLIISAYLNGIVDVFSYTVWTFTFLDLTTEKELSARDSFTDEIAQEEEDAKTHHYHGHKNLGA